MKKEEAENAQIIHDLVGSCGIAATPLRPNGKIKINNQFYDAVSIMGFIEADTPVKIIEKTSFELKVAPIENTKEC